MRTIKYLAYGSNLLPTRLGARIEILHTLGIVELRGWALRFHKAGSDGSGKCNLVVDAQQTAYGVIYEISANSHAKLDKIEGVGKGYISTQISTAEFGDTHVYLAQASHIDEGLVPYDWYHAFVLSGAKFHDFPTDYVANITAVVTKADADIPRSKANFSIVASQTSE